MKITKPTLILDEQKCKANIRFMAERAQRFGVELRPHFKTHQSLAIGHWFKEVGTTKITVSSLTMASYFAKEWNDITVAFPVNILEIDTINSLAKKITLNLLVESTETASFLANQLTSQVNFYLKVNIGNKRAGILPTDYKAIDEILAISKTSDELNFIGFLGHAGQTYACRSKQEIQSAHDKAREVLVALKNQYIQQFPKLIASYGDTPSCSVAENFEGIDEIRPGNYVFYDVMQAQINSCSYDNIAVAMACPIVAIHKEREELIIYGGGIHFSKDRIVENGTTIYGKPVRKTTNGWSEPIPYSYLKKISQEHGVVHMPKEQLANYQVGELIYMLPVHSCMTVDLMREYHTTNLLSYDTYHK